MIYRLKVKNGETEIEIEGDEAFVEHYFSEVSSFISTGKKIKAMGRPLIKGKRKRGRKPKVPKIISPVVKRINLKRLTISQLVELCRLKKERDRILTMGYIITKMNGKHEFRPKAVMDKYIEYNLTPPKRVGYYLKCLCEEGLLVHGRRGGRFKMSDSGILHLSECLVVDWSERKSLLS